jgi:hypothetical protein
MFLELRFTNPLLSVTNVSLTHTGDQPMYLQLLVPEFLSWRNIAVTPLTTVGRVFEVITSRIEPYLFFFKFIFFIFFIFILVFGFWFLVFGFWFLVFGFWFLVFGFWFLVFGFLIFCFFAFLFFCFVNRLTRHIYHDKNEKRYCLFVHSHVATDDNTPGDYSGSYLDDFSRALVDYDIHNMDILVSCEHTKLVLIESKILLR